MAASGKIVWVGRVISGLVSLVFVMTGFMKLRGGAEVVQGMAQLGLPASLMVPLAILEISCAVVYLIPATSVLGAILLTGFIGSAICTHHAGRRSALHPDRARNLRLARPLPSREPAEGAHPAAKILSRTPGASA